MNNSCTTDIVNVYQQFAQLTKAQTTAAVRRGLRDAMSALRKETVANLNSSIIQRGRSKNLYNDTIESGVRMGFDKNTTAENSLTGIVHVMGTRRTGSGTYRLRMLEGGTKERFQTVRKGIQLKKKKSLGRIQAKHFFKNAISTVSSSYDSIILNTIRKYLNKVQKSK